MPKQVIHSAARWATIGLFAASALVFGQDPQANQPVVMPDNGPQTTAPVAQATGGWKRVGDGSVQSASSQPAPQQPADQAQMPQPTYPNSPDQQQQQQQYPAANYPPPPIQQQQQGPMQQGPAPMQQTGLQAPYPQNRSYPMTSSVPPQLNLPAGTYLTVRVNQLLSSDRNQPGDAFSATLTQPLVVNGVVVAEPGQTIGGRVATAQKAGHVEGVAKLGIELTDLALVDGQQLPIHTSLVSRKGPTSVGQDAGTIAATTGVGAAIGAAADWGRGAAIGAGAGAAAGIIGVLVTRGHPSVIYPEQILTFRLEAPLTIATDRSPQAFRYVQPNEYSQQPYYSSQAPMAGYGAGAGAPAPYYSAYLSPYAYAGYPYYYGYGYPYYYPGFSLFVGSGFYGRGYYGSGFYGGRGYVGGRGSVGGRVGGRR